jgi:hypothetical protein
MVKAELPEAGGQRDRADVADVVQVELETDHEEQHRDADLGEQVDLVVGGDDAEARPDRPGCRPRCRRSAPAGAARAKPHRLRRTSTIVGQTRQRRRA